VGQESWGNGEIYFRNKFSEYRGTTLMGGIPGGGHKKKAQKEGGKGIGRAVNGLSFSSNRQTTSTRKSLSRGGRKGGNEKGGVGS